MSNSYAISFFPVYNLISPNNAFMKAVLPDPTYPITPISSPFLALNSNSCNTSISSLSYFYSKI